MSEKFNLKWNDFHTNASKSFGLFRNESYLQDVTLVSDDFKHFFAHKLVLSACSEYFKNIFQQTKHSQPLLCLEGVSSADVQNVLDYVYDGEVRILQDNLEKFLSIASRLSLNGLIGGDETNEEQHGQIKEEIEYCQPTPPQEKEDSQPPRTSFAVKKRPAADKITIAVNDHNNYDIQINQAFEDNVETCDDGSLSCKICGKVASGPSKKGNMKIHIETHLDGLSYDCKFCEKTFRSKDSIRQHNNRFHRC